MAKGRLLSVRELWVHHRTCGERATLKGVAFSLGAGECLGVLGESGAGKSTLAKAMTGLLPPSVRCGGRMVLGEEEIDLGAGGTDWPSIRGTQVGLVFQDAQLALNPMRRIGAHFREALLFHRIAASDGVLPTAREHLKFLNFEDPDSVLNAYPFQLSGGMCQRVCLALALCLRPQVLIADEATSALDVVSQAEVMRLLRKVREKLGVSLVFITHDVTAARTLADKLLVLEDGTVRDYGSVQAVAGMPRSAYTAGLLEASRALPGLSLSEGRREGRGAVLDIERLCLSYNRGEPVFHDLSLTVGVGEIVGILGGSGCGKSTLARCVAGLDGPDSGGIRLDGEVLHCDRRGGRASACRNVQLVFQDGRASLNPGRRVLDLVAEPLRYMGLCRKHERKDRAARSLREVGIGEPLFSRRPPELSTGQCQRVAIARALSAGPRLLVCDEVTSALDAATRNQILRLLLDIHRRNGLSMLLISHDIGILRRCCHRIAVMEGGGFIEIVRADSLGRAEAICHPYTRKLLRCERAMGDAAASER